MPNLSKRNHLFKIELHLHLDGAIRPATIFELGKAKDVSTIRRFQSVAELREFLLRLKPSSLVDDEERLRGDSDAIERCAYELCEDKAAEGVIYFEARYSPHLLANTLPTNPDFAPDGPFTAKGQVGPDEVVAAVIRGFQRGQKDFNIRATQILGTIRGFPEFSEDVIRLARAHSGDGVVGIDICGTAGTAPETIDDINRRIFSEAAEYGVHRTVHAGETGTAQDVLDAIHILHAERIGHGYHLIDEASVLQEVKTLGVHLEACPVSSLITGSVAGWEDHPIKRYAAEKLNFSLSTDDPLLFGNDMMSELRTAEARLGLSREQLWQCVCLSQKSRAWWVWEGDGGGGHLEESELQQLNAARSAFVGAEERAGLENRIQSAKTSYLSQ